MGAPSSSGGGAPTAGVSVTPTSNQASPPQVGPSLFPQQQVAPLTQQQLAAMNSVSQQASGAQNFLNQAQGQQAGTIAGNYLGPNPYLNSYYNAAAEPLVQNYEQAVAPNILQQAAQTGSLGGSGMNQAFQNAETSLAQGLGNLGANIYEPAYQYERGLQQGAAQGAPSLASGQFIPSQMLASSGQMGQQQAQNVLNQAYQNAYQQANWPFQALGMLGSSLGTAAGPAGNSVSFGSLSGGGGMK